MEVRSDEGRVESRFSPFGDNVSVNAKIGAWIAPNMRYVTPQVFSSITALHLHEHKHASFHVILCGCN
jgi:hypothetical protein